MKYVTDGGATFMCFNIKLLRAVGHGVQNRKAKEKSRSDGGEKLRAPSRRLLQRLLSSRANVSTSALSVS